MSSFDVTVHPITISDHPNADALSLGSIEGMAYQFVVAKDLYKTGDVGCYIPEGAIVPQPIIEEMGLTGRLAGKEANRVKAIKLRGAISQGLFYRPTAGLPDHWLPGANVADELGITKWEPPIPVEMAGQVRRIDELKDGQERLHGLGPTIFQRYTDIENWMRFPRVLQEGELVDITEKIHGSCCIVGLLHDRLVVSSLGIAARHLILEESATNVYWRAVRQYDLEDKLRRLLAMQNYILGTDSTQIMLFGEVTGVQDLKYGCKEGKIGFYAFDLLYDDPSASLVRYLDVVHFVASCETYSIPTVPSLYRGPFSHQATLELAQGQSTIPGANHIREGVVVKPYKERHDDRMGRVALKYINPAYLVRKNGSENH